MDMASWILKRRRIAVMGRSLSGWLGIEQRPLRSALRRFGYRTYELEKRPGHERDRAACSSLDDEALDRIGLYRLCVEMELCPAEMQTAPGAEERRRSIREELRQLAAVVQGVIDQVDPHQLVIVQGYEPLAAISRSLGIARGIRVIALENTAVNSRLLWDDISAITTNRNLSKSYYWRFYDHVSQEDADAYSESLWDRKQELKSAEHASPQQKFSRSRTGKPLVLFLGQVYTDSSVIFGSGAWATPTAILRQLTVLSKTMEFELAVKLHPKEASGCAPMTGAPYDRLTWRKMLADPTLEAALAGPDPLAVDKDNEYDTYSMIDQADAVVTLNSQAGLEAASRGVPTVVCGDAFYAGLGFTFDAPDPCAFQAQLSRALGVQGEVRDQFGAEARKFTYVYFERYCIKRDPLAVASLAAEGNL
jgi:hypothetical protein